MATTFLIGTFCLLVSCLFSLSTGGIISKTIYELIYHSVAAILLLVASIYLIVKVQDFSKSSEIYKAYFAAGVISLTNLFKNHNTLCDLCLIWNVLIVGSWSDQRIALHLECRFSQKELPWHLSNENTFNRMANKILLALN